MKHLIYALLVIATALFGCSEKEDSKLLYRINEIKAMGDTLPQVAMQRLDSIRPLFEHESEYMRNKIALLDIRLRDKAYITHVDDDTIKELCRYFESYVTAKELQEAYYYMGSVYRDMNDYPNAVTSFLKSATIAEQSFGVDTAVWETTYFQLAYIYKTQFHYKEALNTILKGLNVAESAGIANERTYMSVAHSYFRNSDTIQAVKYMKKAIEMIDNNKSHIDNADIIALAMSIFTNCGKKYEAGYCYELIDKIPQKPHNYLINLSLYYERFVSVDSAAMARIELYNTTKRVESRYDAARWLARYYNLKGEYEKAAEYAIKFIDANNEVLKKRDFENTANANNFFLYRRNKEEEIAIMEKAANDRLGMIIAFAVSVIVALCGAVLYYYRKKKLLDIIMRKEMDIKSVRELIELKKQELAAQNDELEHRARELEVLKNNNSKLVGQLQSAESDFKLLVAQNSQLTRITLMNDFAGEAKDIIEKVRMASKGLYHLSDDEWKELLGAVDRLYPGFTHAVQAGFKKMSEAQLRVCYLAKIGLSGPQIVNLTGYPRQTVWDRIKRAQKVLGIDGAVFT
ncbi:MAG: tetratricopeptide repeat protein [Bacteroidaceae bacterium]|nr:tetratricopeptide repeat protein [Bacteroidaceae bacterium]